MPSQKPVGEKTLEQVAEELGRYPLEAFDFVQRGLNHTARKVHGAVTSGKRAHVTGQQLCEGLRDLARSQWGLLAPTVLRRWNIVSTLDFGRIVFALVDSGLLQKNEEDTLEDFRNVFDLRSLESDYRITIKP